MTGLQSFDVGSRPFPKKPQRPGQPLPKRFTDSRCFEVGEVLELPGDALAGCIRAGLLPVVGL